MRSSRRQAATIHPLAVAANRNSFVQAVLSNFFGLNAPAIAAARGPLRGDVGRGRVGDGRLSRWGVGGGRAVDAVAEPVCRGCRVDAGAACGSAAPAACPTSGIGNNRRRQHGQRQHRRRQPGRRKHRRKPGNSNVGGGTSATPTSAAATSAAATSASETPATTTSASATPAAQLRHRRQSGRL